MTNDPAEFFNADNACDDFNVEPFPIILYLGSIARDMDAMGVSMTWKDLRENLDGTEQEEYCLMRALGYCSDVPDNYLVQIDTIRDAVLMLGGTISTMQDLLDGKREILTDAIRLIKRNAEEVGKTTALADRIASECDEVVAVLELLVSE